MADYQDPLVVAPSDGVVRGDMKAMPNRGTATGFTGVGDDRYGMDVSQNALNARPMGHQGSDPMDQTSPPGGGDFSASSNNPGAHGTALPDADSDPAADTVPEDQRD